MLAAIGDAKTCPHGHPIQPGERISGVPLADVEQGAKVTILRFENEAEELLHLFKAEGLEPGREGVIAETDDESVSVDFGGATATLTRSVAETVSVRADPSPPAAHRAARAARALQGPLRQVTSSEVRLAGRRTSASAAARPAGRRARDRAQAVERVPDLGEARVERRDAEADRVRAAEVRRDAGARSARG